MKISGKRMMPLLLAAPLLAGLAACDQKPASADKGPAERAGEQIDKASVKLGEQLNKAGEKVGQGLEKAGEKLQNASREAQKKDQ